MKGNPDKSHTILSTNEKVNVNIDGKYIENSSSVKLLSITIDSELKFNNHLEVC